DPALPPPQSATWTTLDQKCSKKSIMRHGQACSVSAKPYLGFNIILAKKHTRDGFPGFFARNTWIENYVGSRFSATDYERVLSAKRGSEWHEFAQVADGPKAATIRAAHRDDGSRDEKPGIECQ